MKIKKYLSHNVISNKYIYLLYKEYFRRFRTSKMEESYLGHWYRYTNKCEPVYYVLRYSNHLGIGAMANHLMLHWAWAKNKGYIPIILNDISFDKKLSDNQRNLWEMVFDVNMKLADALKQKNVYISHIDGAYINFKIPKELKEFVNPKMPYSLRMITEKDKLPLYYKYASEFMKPNDEIKRAAAANIDKMAKYKVLGIGLREEFSIIRELGGTKDISWLKDILINHPITSTIDETLNITREYMKKTGCTHIYISSMFEDVIERFRKEFGKEKVFFIEAERKSFESILNNPDMLRDYYFNTSVEGREDYYISTKRYVTDCLILARCNSLLIAPAGQIRVIGMLKQDEYENLKVLPNYNSKVVY